jgi:Protein of unknown function (DUF2924)
MDESVYVEIERLERMRIEELRERYREVYGEETRTHHKQHLVRRIAWRLQVLAQGDLCARARQRALEIAQDADLRIQVPSQWMPRDRMTKPVRDSRQDRRLPPVGTVLTRFYQGRQVAVQVAADGFEYDGRQYGSLSAVARAVTGTRWNGLLFFGLAQRKEPRRARR